MKRVRLIDDLSRIGHGAWNELLAADADATPFLRYEFLHALHESGCASARTGWTPTYLTLTDAQGLAAAVPLYRKDHSFGEYVFDWAWAQAHEERGLAYYPKWLAAVPFTPAPGSRLIARDAQARSELARQLLALVQDSNLSSLHVLLAPTAQIEMLAAAGLLVQAGVQFHWRNGGYRDFEQFLAALSQDKRRCYRITYAQHRSTPYLSLAFFQQLARTMAENLMLVLAHRDGAPVASAFGVFDTRAGGGTLYGRYWGATEFVSCLHFECCYYQMIEFAIERGLAVFEGGAQGAHKVARGLDPVPTLSAHWIADPVMRRAIAAALARQSHHVSRALDELAERSAFKVEQSE